MFDGADLVLAEVEECERAIAAWQARQIRALVRFAALRPGRVEGSVDEFAADEVGPLLRISRNAALGRLHLAIELHARLPGVLAALGRGDIDLYKARIVAELTRPLTGSHAAAVERQVLVRAAEQTPGQLRTAVRRAVLRVDPHGAEDRRQVQVAQRRVIVNPGEEGTADLAASNLDAADATAIYQRLDDMARAMRGDSRTMDQRRADTLVDLLLGRPIDCSSPTDTAGSARPVRPVRSIGSTKPDRPTKPLGSAEPGRSAEPDRSAEPAEPAGSAGAAVAGRAQIQVTVAASTLLGLDDHPGELAGYGPITATAARRLAADGLWRRIVTDPPSGAILDISRTAYRPSTAVAEFVRTRDRTCRFPGCRHPARKCDIDHNIPHPHGLTTPGNLCCLCRVHHRLKSRGHWSLLHEPNGAITWTSPTGRHYTTDPEPRTH